MKLTPRRLTAFVVAIFVVAIGANAQKLKPEEVVAKHLDSIADAEKRTALKTFISVGDVRVTNITRKLPPSVGRVVLASAANKSFVGMNLNSNDNPSEKIVFNGKDVRIDFTLPGARSILGNLLQSNQRMVEDGLFSGALSTNWAMMQLASRNAKISSEGSKKINGVETYAVKYSPKGGSDYDITMYFEASTFRHIRTEYKRTASAAMGITIDQSARQSETRIRITEDYSDFKAVDGYTFPHKYKMLYSIAGQNGTTEVSWEFDLLEFAVNRPMDDATFAIDAK